MTDEISNNGVVVTGMGLVTPIGVTVETFWSSLLEGRCGIGPVEGVEGEHLGLSVAAQIKDYDPRTPLKAWQRDKTILHSDRYSWLAAAAADQAIKQSTLELPLSNPYRAVCIIGSAAGGQMSGERGARDRFVDNKRAVHPMFLVRTIASSAAAHVGIEYGVKGPTYAINSAGASAAHSISIGRDYIRRGQADIAIVGGADSLITYGAMLAAQALGLLSPEGCYPFSANRSGTVLAEGAGILVLESERHAKARGAKIYGELTGYGATSDGYDMVQPSGEGAMRCMKQALATVDGNVDYINTHGTATEVGDSREIAAIREVFGENIPHIQSTKSLTGHSLGAAGAQEAIYSLLMMQEGFIGESAHIEELDPEFEGIPIVRQRIDNAKIDTVLSNSFGFGGTNATLAFQRYNG